jgi:hypothetical protein
MGILAGVVDRAKAFARVGLGKAGSAATTTAAKAAHTASDAASKGAERLNRAADELPNQSEGGTSTTDDGAAR